jgi:predicted ATPase
MLCLVSRPAADYKLVALEKMMSCEHVTTIFLTGLDSLNSERVILSCYDDMSQDSRPEKVAKLLIDKVMERTHGNPLFVRSFTLALREKGLSAIVCDSLPPYRYLLDFPAHVQSSEFESAWSEGIGLASSILTQFDRLNPEFCEFLRSVSCISERFDLNEAAVAFGELTPEEVTIRKLESLQTTWSNLELLIERNDQYCFLERIVDAEATFRLQDDAESIDQMSFPGSSSDDFRNPPLGGPTFLRNLASISAEKPPTYKFRHVQFLNAVYRTASFSSRQIAHRDLALYYSKVMLEETKAFYLPKVSPLIKPSGNDAYSLPLRASFSITLHAGHPSHQARRRCRDQLFLFVWRADGETVFEAVL